jgi:hypothetical protein
MATVALGLAIEMSQTESKYKAALILMAVLLEINLGDFENAMTRLGTRESVLASQQVAVVFNYAMAEWGKTAVIPRDLFKRVRVLNDKNPPSTEANYAQCLAVVDWGLGNLPSAGEWLTLAKERSTQPTKVGKVFSCWSYIWKSPAEFCSDVEELGRMIEGEDVLPEFIARTLN